MKILKQSLIVFVGQIILIAALVLIIPHSGHGQPPPGPGQPTQNVKVVNPASEPVPVTGTVTVANLGSSPLPVTGTVTVSNLGTNPLPVSDSNNPAKQPFQIEMSTTDFFVPDRFTVPAGKRLVIEMVTIHNLLEGTNCYANRVTLSTSVRGVEMRHFFFPEHRGTRSDLSFYGVSLVTRLYADPGTVVRIGDLFLGCSIRSTGWTISGHLIEVQ
jgi:hypothetical protein